jgi:hypothetical protein
MTLATNVVAYGGAGGGVPAIRPPQAEVCLDGVVAPRLRLDGVEQSAGNGPRAWFSAGLGRSTATGEDLRLEQQTPAVRPGSLIRATLLRGGTLPGEDAGNLVLFEGRVGRIEMTLDPGGEGLRFEAEDPAVALLGRPVGGRRTWTSYGDAKRLDGLPLVFNPEGRPNASAQPYDTGDGRSYTIFAADFDPDATLWTLDQAVAYLVAEHGASEDVDAPMPDEVQAALDSQALRDVVLEGSTLGDALAALLKLAGAWPVVAAEPGPDGLSRRLEIVPADSAAGSWLAHQPVGQTFAAGATDFAAMTISMHFDASPRRYTARGDVKIYESTFPLVAGWNDALATTSVDDFSPEANATFDTVRDVFRKWVLNEAGDYTPAPYSRGAAVGLASVFDGAATVRRRRRFLPCISGDALGRSHGVYVEVSLDGGSTWDRLNLGVRILTDECGLILTDDPLPPRYLAAAMRGLVRVRVTASLESDSRLTADYGDAADTDLPGCSRHLDVAEGYRFRKVTAESRFHGQAAADEVDDTARLEDLVREAYEADLAAPVPSRIDMPYLAMGHRVGERILGVQGRWIDLAPSTPDYTAAPRIRLIRHTFAPVPQTELELE